MNKLRQCALALMLCAAVTAAQTASALIMWSADLDLDTSGNRVVGAIDILSGADPANEEAVVALANTLLAQGVGFNSEIDSRLYRTHTVDNYSGVLLLSTAVRDDTGGLHVPAGFEYVIGKYDGQNAGWVVFYLGGEEATLPQYSKNLWSRTDQWELSNWTGVSTTVPEPATMASSALLLLPLAVSAFRRIRRRR